ncbi:hypothetical protein RFI_20650, partial [Reticulomyxa filosa]
IEEAKEKAEKHNKLHERLVSINEKMDKQERVRDRMPLIDEDDNEKINMKDYENTKVEVTKVMDPQLEQYMPHFQIPMIRAIESQFVQHLTFELIHVSSFYADQCEFFANQVKKNIFKKKKKKYFCSLPIFFFGGGGECPLLRNDLS